MKNLIFKLSFVVSFLCISCERQLNTVPTDFVNLVDYYKNEDQLNKGLTGIYSVLGDPAMYQDALLHNMSYSNDDGVFVYTQAALIAPSNFSYSTTESTITNLWNSLYRGINLSNILLEAIEGEGTSSVNPDAKAKIKAQALFLRAYYYYMLVDRWGAVPMPLSATKSAKEIDMARTPVADVYAKIVEDMTAAEAVLPQASELGANSAGRVSKNTAQGILARVCLSMTGFPLNDESKYEDVIFWCNKVMSKGENSLNPNYAELFVRQARDEYYVQENMWEVEFYGNVSDNYREQGYVGVRNGSSALLGEEYPGFGYNFLGANIMLFNKYQMDAATFLSKDLRRERNITPYIWVGGTAAVQVMTKRYFAIKTSINLYQRWAGKWRREEEVKLPRFKNGNGTNFPLLRYSDVLLMFAEAENHVNGPTSLAYNAINEVRKRAYGTGFRVSSIVFNAATDGGEGYTVAPDVVIGKSSDLYGANTAEAYTTIANGKVTGVVLVNMGGFYTAAPPIINIVSSNGVGSGAKATAVMSPINPVEAELASGLSPDEFFEEIKNERSRELAFESLRSSDLRRWGILIPTIREMGNVYGPAAPCCAVQSAYLTAAANISDKHLYYPIPPSEIATNSLVVQNPGW
ncbi:MAG: RagB/SusD family nutrient uptake outer membrane protein [Pedobacter sp.]|nr:MAG: RagB/SusD family nutrient uptake outer membrane protein [Pedobacter sp.]